MSVFKDYGSATFGEPMEFGEPNDQGDRATMMRLGPADAEVTEYMTCHIIEVDANDKYILELRIGMPIKSKIVARIVGDIDEMKIIHMILHKCIEIAEKRNDKRKGENDASGGEGTTEAEGSHQDTTD